MRDRQLYLFEAEDLLDDRRPLDAIAAFDLAESNGNDPDRCAAGRWAASMLLGNFGAAWRECDSIRERGAPDPHRFWNGEDVRGKRVIVRCLHGLGDAVQCLRFIAPLRKLASRVIVEVPPRMVALARAIREVDEVITWGVTPPNPAPHWDVQIEVTELPYVFRMVAKNLPLATNYVHVPQALAQKAALPFRKSGRARVGVVWSAGEWNPSRSIPIAQLKTLLRHAEFDFWNLQGGGVRQEWSRLGSALNLRDAPEFCCDAGLLPLAAFMQHLDLLITVDTFAAHLGGALGIPTWVMLQQRADWRWMMDREDSPWYPSLRLYRQTRQGDWSSMIQPLETDLNQWSDDHRCGKRVA